MIRTSSHSHQSGPAQARRPVSATAGTAAGLDIPRSGSAKCVSNPALRHKGHWSGRDRAGATPNRSSNTFPTPVPTLRHLSTILHTLANAGKTIGNSIKKYSKMGLVGLALASPLVRANKAEAGVEGRIDVTYNIQSVGGYTNVIGFIEGGSYGWDQFDSAYYEIPFPGNEYTKAVGSIEGREAKIIALPPLEFNDSVSESFNGSLIVQRGTINLEEASHYLTWSIGGNIANMTSIDVSINGVDARTTNRLNLGTLKGSYGKGEHSTASWTINVTYNGTNGSTEPNTPIEEPDEVETYPTGIFKIDSLHEKSPTSTIYVIHKLGASDEPNDPGDEEFTINGEVTPPYLVSHVLDSKTAKYKDLTTDVRSPSTEEPVLLQQKIHSDYGFARISGGDTNALIFSFPDSNEAFGDRVMVFREIYRTDPNDPNFYEEGAPFLIKDAIAADPNGMAVYLLPNLKNKIPSGTINEGTIEFYETVPLAVADFNKNGIVDVNDGYLLEGAMGYMGNSMFDIARLKDPLALPNSNNYGEIVIGQGGDKIVDGTDRTAFNELLIADKRRRGLYEGGAVEESGVGVCEGFENGRFDEAHWVNYGGWSVSLERVHSGTYSARCAESGGSLKWSGFLAGGEVSFWAYIGRGGSLKFSINGIIEHEHAGGEQWERVAAPVGQGTNNLRWEGYGPLFIDDVCVPQQ